MAAMKQGQEIETLRAAFSEAEAGVAYLMEYYDTENNRLIVVDTQHRCLQIYNKLSRCLIPQLNL